MTPFMDSVKKMVRNKRRRVHRKCQKIVNTGGFGGKYYIPNWVKETSRCLHD